MLSPALSVCPGKLPVLALCDIAEKDAELAIAVPFEPKGVDIEPTVQRLRLVGEAHRFASEGNLAIRLIPMDLMIRGEFAHAFSQRPGYAGLLLKRSIRFPKAIVVGFTFFIE